MLNYINFHMTTTPALNYISFQLIGITSIIIILSILAIYLYRRKP